jgi:hypothetical protein
MGMKARARKTPQTRLRDASEERRRRGLPRRPAQRDDWRRMQRVRDQWLEQLDEGDAPACAWDG